ncbi:MAG TPA: ATP-dependent DNA helicase RecG, partial [Candidatus Saccharimonadales bacterium]|nr:ATP-dependent DNA helicase RecG [Candidatus Saccharimonadales bacterium]
FMEKYFKVGDEVIVFGKPNSLRPRTIDHPETEVVTDSEPSIHFQRIAPIYPLTEGLPQRWLRSLLWRLVEEFEASIAEPHPDLNLTREKVAWPGGQISLPARGHAVKMIHFPEEMSDIDLGRQRLALDEFVELQKAIQVRRRNLEKKARALPCAGDNRWIKPFLAGLGFDLTEAQARVLREIRKDMAGPHPMRRLLQGDVGAGKTVVAACTVLMALESGANAALMAPTEILSGQHGQNFRRWLEPLGARVELRTSSTRLPVGAMAAPALFDSPTLFIGTHALLEETFLPEKLGLVIIDEQHKFGVVQREKLLRKGAYPHLLVMTATPIPRTLGLTLYGDLEISIIDQIPPGRGRVKTFVRQAASLPKVWKFMREQLARGQQGYIVYSRLAEADSPAGIKAVTQEFQNLEKIFAPWRLGLLHGRLNGEQKEQVMADFRANRTQLLLATSIIEVGLDVANATIMLIENAEQFGLAQLHQLRGRIGRGAAESYCILIDGGKTDEAIQRLKILEETTDGFRIAEEDMKLRGPGELLGRQQSGIPALRFGDLAQDRTLVERARAIVRETPRHE